MSVYGRLYCADVPGAPGQPMIISSSTTSISFSWLPPIDNGGSLLTNYEIWYKQVIQTESSWT